LDKEFINSIFSIERVDDFEELALKAFVDHFEKNEVYHNYCQHLKINPGDVKSTIDIPFLPIHFFKTHKIFLEGGNAELVFTSSGTTGDVSSWHHVKSSDLYERSFTLAFEQFYGPVSQYAILALLPSYLEKTDSSLVYMVNKFIQKSENDNSGFYLHNLEELAEKLIILDKSGEKILLFGVSFALLDLIGLIGDGAIANPANLIVMETGGMKGRRKELVREELHNQLCKAFGVEHIHSEYGMTELLSQAYSKSNGVFKSPPWMKIIIRDANDPLSYVASGQGGGINIIDLANIYSCPFIATDDLGKMHENGEFEVLGRFDSSEVRGCNLLVEGI